MLAAHILSLMLTVGPAPGVSPYSVVPTTSKTPPCSDKTPICRRPWYSPYWDSLVRQETRSEALGRYWTIAKAIAGEAKEDDRVAKLLLTVTLHESSWRRDIHSGKGKFALGDGGRSWSLVQARLGRGARKGFRLVGVHLAATERAVGWGATHLRRCTRGRDVASTFRCYGGVSNGKRKKAIDARVASFRRFSAKPKLLSADVCKQLGIAPVAGKLRVCAQRQ